MYHDLWHGVMRSVDMKTWVGSMFHCTIAKGKKMNICNNLQ